MPNKTNEREENNKSDNKELVTKVEEVVEEVDNTSCVEVDTMEEVDNTSCIGVVDTVTKVEAVKAVDNTSCIGVVDTVTRVEAVEITTVYLRIYDLSHGMARLFSKGLLGVDIEGVWHTSIEVYGKEYFFHSTLRCEDIGKTSSGLFIERIELGRTDCTKELFEEFFADCKYAWNECTYDLLENNCNNFTNWISNFLVDKDIPEYILHLPNKVKNNENFRRLFYK